MPAPVIVARLHRTRTELTPPRDESLHEARIDERLIAERDDRRSDACRQRGDPRADRGRHPALGVVVDRPADREPFERAANWRHLMAPPFGASHLRSECRRLRILPYDDDQGVNRTGDRFGAPPPDRPTIEWREQLVAAEPSA